MSDELRALVRGKVEAGSPRASILTILREKGMDAASAAKLHESVRAEVRRERLPQELRQAGRRSVILRLAGFVLFGALTAVFAVAIFARMEADEPDSGRGAKLIFFPAGVAVACLAQAFYGFSRFAAAREAERRID